MQGRIPDVVLECLQYLRKRSPNVTISVEIEKPGREGLPDLVPEADVVFFSKSWVLVSDLFCLVFPFSFVNCLVVVFFPRDEYIHQSAT